MDNPLSPGWLGPLEKASTSSVPLGGQVLSISRACPPPSVQGDTLGFFLKQTNKCQEVRPEAGWSPQAPWGSRASVARNGPLDPLPVCGPAFIFLSGDPEEGGLGRKQFEEEANPPPRNPAAGRRPPLPTPAPMHSRWSKELKRQQQFFKTSR